MKKLLLLLSGFLLFAFTSLAQVANPILPTSATFSPGNSGDDLASNTHTQIMRQTRCTTTRSIFSSTTPSPESKGSCRSSTAPIMKTLSLPFSQPVSPTGATASARISPAKSSPSPRKTCSNTAPTAQTPSIHSTSARRNFRSTTHSPSPCREFLDFFITGLFRYNKIFLFILAMTILIVLFLCNPDLSKISH